MGTINYNTSNYITMGIIPEHEWDYVTDKVCFHEMEKLAEEWGVDTRSAILQNIQDNLEADITNVEWLLNNKYNFHYYYIKIEYGYYEGFSLFIGNNYGVAYDSYRDKPEAQKEITQIKQFLLDCHNLGLVSVYPGWGTTYRSREETEADIEDAIREMREEVKRTPTWRQYERESA